MIVQLIRGLNMNTPSKMVKDGRKFSGCFLEPGIYPDWDVTINVPRSAKILTKMPDTGLLEERGTPVRQVMDTLATQTEAMMEKANSQENAVDNPRPVIAPIPDDQIKAFVEANRAVTLAKGRAK